MSINHLLSKSLIGLTSGFILLYVALPVIVTLAAPLIQNPYSECPPNSSNIWVQLDDNNFGGQVATLNIPFDTGQTTINNNVYVNYLLGVLISEVGPTTDFNPVDDETLKAMAIAARTVAYKNCGVFSYGGHRGIDDIDKQVYDPRKRETWLNSPTLGQTELDRYQQAIDDTAGMYLTYDGDVFDAQYRDKSDEWTDSVDEDGDGTFEPHQGIYDPAGRFHATPVYTMPGLMQVNSNHWATGENHGELLPQYNYLQILAHYYTDVHIRDSNSNILTPAYRWNSTAGIWADTGSIYPPVMTPDQYYYFNPDPQNSGTQDWAQFSTRMVFQWKTLTGTVVSTEYTPSTLDFTPPGERWHLVQAAIQAPASSGVYTLTIDMQRVGESNFFHNREPGRPWFTLDYRVCVGDVCPKLFLPIIMKNAN